MSGYYPGTANSFADLQSAIESALTTEGWASADGIFNKGGAYFQLTNSTTHLAIAAGTGQSGASLTGAVPFPVRIASLTVRDPISWPVNYEIHISEAPDEVYAVMTYNGGRVQTLAFGISPAPGNPTGYWISGIGGPNNNYASATAGYTWQGNQGSPVNQGNIAPVSGDGNNTQFVSAGVLASYLWPTQNLCPYRYHKGTAWNTPTGPGGPDGSSSGGAYALSLMTSLPSQANQGMVLVPAYLFEYASDFRTIPILQLGHLRHCRIDNYNPGDVVPFGPDNWKVYPIGFKNATQRTPGTPPDTGALYHTGTYGFAVRYHGS